MVQRRYRLERTPLPPRQPTVFHPFGTDSVPNFFGTVVDGLRLPGIGCAWVGRVECKQIQRLNLY